MLLLDDAVTRRRGRRVVRLRGGWWFLANADADFHGGVFRENDVAAAR
jgi:hypothetical protein